jgi:formate hydrogenlyase subunit 3/multisubunit Na+/H+ antiporter MnhD subunit
MFGTSNFYLLNFFFYIMSVNEVMPKFFITLNLTVFITGLFIKLGLSPYQFFKIETYKGIPLFMIIIYTTLYLTVYVYFFILLIVIQIPSLRDFIGSFLSIFIVISVIYLVSLLFDTKNFKAFLSYSTLITVINVFITILVL